MQNLLLILVVLAIAYFVFFENKNDKVEGYNDQAGRFCTTCSGKTPNECMRCFNCGFCVDKDGNAACIGGDHKGPFNYERCTAWYSGDPYARMLQRNANYRCSYGPRSSNRLIGI